MKGPESGTGVAITTRRSPGGCRGSVELAQPRTSQSGGIRSQIHERVVVEMTTAQETNEKQQILVVEDDEEVRNVLQDIVERLGHRSIEAQNVSKALRILSQEDVDLMLLDIYLRGGTGLDLLKSLRRKRSAVPTVVVSGHISETIARQLVKFGVRSLVTKPFRPSRLAAEIERVITCDGHAAIEDTPPRFNLDEPDLPDGASCVGPRHRPGRTEERRASERIPIRLPVLVESEKPRQRYLSLLDINAEGMQIRAKDLNILKSGATTDRFRFQIPVVANVAWVNGGADGGFEIGWTFDDIIQQFSHPPSGNQKIHREGSADLGQETLSPDSPPENACDATEIADERRTQVRMGMQLPIEARGSGGKRLKMTLTDISARGMRTSSEGLEVLYLRRSKATQKLVFDISVEAHLAWINSGPDGNMTTGWRFADEQGGG